MKGSNTWKCFIFVTLYISGISYASRKSGGEFCVKYICRCIGLTAVCSGENVTYIPIFPRYITSILFTDANLRNVTDKDFFNLTFNHVTRLVFRNSSIVALSPRTFSGVKPLKRLTISHNPSLNITDVMTSLQSLDKSKFQNLDLNNNNWKEIPDHMFRSFQNSSLESINLSGNKFKFLNFKMFTDLNYLQNLNIRSNAFRKIKFEMIASLKELRLGDNILTGINNWCDKDKNSLMPNLSMLTLDDNRISNLDPINCLPELKSLTLSLNSFKKIPKNAFLNLPKLQKIILERVGKPLKIIEEFAFNSTSIEYISLRESRFHFSRLNGTAIANMFKNTKQIRHLDLSYNILPNDVPSLKALLTASENVARLILENTRLHNLPSDVFLHLPRLEELSIADNRVAYWSDGKDIFGNLTSIRHLDLSGNLISIINETSFPETLLKSLKSINLSKNSYSCICEQMWFVNWLRKTNVTLMGYKYKCSQPKELRGLQLKEYKPTVESCTPWNPLFTVAIAISSFGVLVLILIILAYKCQTNIKNSIYLARVYNHRRRGYLPITSGEDFEYHAFVVYCDADRKWVHNDLMKKLETDEGFKLCIHDRDFEAGESISENVDNFLQKSWKVIVVMSDQFAKDEWCQWQVDIVQERRRRYGRDVFLLIMLKNISSKSMTSPLKTLLETTPYLGYRKGLGENIFWRAAIEGLRKHVVHSPVSVL